MPSDDDRPPRIARRVERDDDEFSDPPPEGPAPYLFRRPHSNEGRLLGYALPATVGGLILAAIASEASGRGNPLSAILMAGCVGVWAWGLTYLARRAAFK